MYNAQYVYSYIVQGIGIMSVNLSFTETCFEVHDTHHCLGCFYNPHQHQCCCPNKRWRHQPVTLNWTFNAAILRLFNLYILYIYNCVAAYTCRYMFNLYFVFRLFRCYKKCFHFLFVLFLFSFYANLGNNLKDYLYSSLFKINFLKFSNSKIVLNTRNNSY